MLATAGPLPGDGDDRWIFELKWDGFRAMLWATDGRTRLLSRNGNDLSTAFPELVTDPVPLPDGTLLDGELIVAGPDGRPVWSEVRRRTATRRPAAVAEAVRTRPATLMVFDAPITDGIERCREPLEERRARLEALDLPHGCRLVDQHDEGGALWQATTELRLEGVVAKRRGSCYRPGTRSRDWVKTKHTCTSRMTVVGVRRAGGRVTAVLLAGEDGEPVTWLDRWVPSISRDALAVGLPVGGPEVLGDGPTVEVRHLATPGLREPMIVAVDA